MPEHHTSDVRTFHLVIGGGKGKIVYIPKAGGVQEKRVDIFDGEMKGLARPQLEKPRHALRRCNLGAALGEVCPVRRIVLGVGQHFTNFISHRYRQAIAIVYARKLLAGNAHQLPYRAIHSTRGGGEGHHAAFGYHRSRQNDRKDAPAEFPAEKQKKIFERFYQAESGHEGSGIGLSLVQRLVELHHGHITLESKVGEGSTFSIYIPQDKSMYTSEELLAQEEGAKEQRAYYTNAHDVYIDDEELLETSALADGEKEKRGKILVVDDNQELRQYLVSGLSSDFNLLEADNGQKALDILKGQEVDLVITDVMMPVMDGVKLCKAIKQNIRTCHIPVYMLSAKADTKYQLEGLQVGADDYIPKPFSMPILKTKIQNVLRTRYRVFERYSNTTEVEPEKLANNTMDEELLRRAIAVIEKNMDNVEFSTEQFAREMNMSRSNLHLKLKAITGKSAIDFIHKIRFNRACQLLKEGRYSVSEISFMVGYNTPSYFAARFKKYMGCLPTEYGKNNA